MTFVSRVVGFSPYIRDYRRNLLVLNRAGGERSIMRREECCRISHVENGSSPFVDTGDKTAAESPFVSESRYGKMSPERSSRTVPHSSQAWFFSWARHRVSRKCRTIRLVA